MSEKLSFEQATARFGYRYTMEHVPNWAKKPCKNGKFYAPQYRTDQEWYDNTVFPPQAKYCTQSNESWPLGRWLDTPFSLSICAFCNKTGGDWDGGHMGLGMVNGIDLPFCDSHCHQAYLDLHKLNPSQIIRNPAYDSPMGIMTDYQVCDSGINTVGFVDPDYDDYDDMCSY